MGTRRAPSCLPHAENQGRHRRRRRCPLCRCVRREDRGRARERASRRARWPGPGAQAYPRAARRGTRLRRPAADESLSRTAAVERPLVSATVCTLHVSGHVLAAAEDHRCGGVRVPWIALDEARRRLRRRVPARAAHERSRMRSGVPLSAFVQLRAPLRRGARPMRAAQQHVVRQPRALVLERRRPERRRPERRRPERRGRAVIRGTALGISSRG